MTPRGARGRPHDVTDRITRVRIDRLVLYGVDLDMHDAASLPARIAAELQRSTQASDGDHAAGPTARDLAAEIASRIRVEIVSRRPLR
jgi:hypothetical protein